MTDEGTCAPSASPAPQDEPVPGQTGTATPEERLAETLADDPEVGSDGTGMGGLP